MAKCKLCGQHGLFLSVNSDGYCKSCAKYIEERAKEKEEERKRKQAELEKILALPKYEITLSDAVKKRNRAYPGNSFANITPKGKYYNFVVFDTETTGLAPSRDRIIELAAVKFKDGFPVETFHTFINPERSIPEEASRINKICDKDVENAPVIGKVIESFDSFVGDNILVAHNLEFDLKFIYYSGSDILTGTNRLIDTLEQAKKLLKSPKIKYDIESETYGKDYDSDYDVYDYQLDTLCNYYHIPLASHHSALSDAYATGKLFLRLVFEKQETMPTEIFTFLKS